MVAPALIAAGGSLLSGILGNNAAKKAAKAQTRAAREQLAYARDTRDLTRADLAPWRTAGTNALSMWQDEMGMTGKPGSFTKSQDYLFGLEQGQDSVNALAAMRNGPGLSGASLTAMNRFGQDYGSQRRGEYLDRLYGLSNAGQAAAAGQAQNAWNGAAAMTNALGNMGDAQAAGAIGQANAWSGALDNAMGAWGYLNATGGYGAAPYTASGYGYNPAVRGGQVFSPFR